MYIHNIFTNNFLQVEINYSDDEETDHEMGETEPVIHSQPLFPKFPGDIGDQTRFNYQARLHAIADLDQMGVFEQFLDSALVDYIVEETNRYANVDKADHLFSTNAVEIRTFIAILFFTGYHSVPQQDMYWSTSPDSEFAIVRKAMSRNRFRLLKKYLHLCNNHNVTNDKSFKVKQFMELLNERFLRWSICQQNLSVDECMVPYFGRSTLKQFIRNKPIRFGFKNWCLCDSTGYCYRANFYVGKDETPGRQPLGTRVVNALVQSCVLDRNSSVLYMDNFFTSLSLLSSLADSGLRATGTIRRNRVASVPLKTDAEMKKSTRG